MTIPKVVPPKHVRGTFPTRVADMQRKKKTPFPAPESRNVFYPGYLSFYFRHPRSPKYLLLPPRLQPTGKKEEEEEEEEEEEKYHALIKDSLDLC